MHLTLPPLARPPEQRTARLALRRIRLRRLATARGGGCGGGAPGGLQPVRVLQARVGGREGPAQRGGDGGVQPWPQPLEFRLEQLAE